jgi:hypothetical protein
MTDKYQRTPDGRTIRVPDDATSDAHNQPVDEQLNILQPFIDACLVIAPEQSLNGHSRTGLLLFLLGAADEFWRRHELDDTRFPAFAQSLLQRSGVSGPAAATLSDTLPQLMSVEIARETFQEGAETLNDWLNSHDSNSVLRLTEVINRWQWAASHTL